MPLHVDPDLLIAPGPGCPVDCTIEALGSRASILLLRQAFYGDRRFDAFVEHTGISEATVAKRLQELVDVGALRKVPYQEPGSRRRDEYELTAQGEELLPVVLGLFLWGQRHLAGVGTGLQLTGPGGEPLQIVLQTAGGQPVEPRDIHIELNDGDAAR
ncbi:winged helix-turn-helix transcriptional regulator [Brachybacterium hainanense]|uniref:Winged helix-turn-helix transcriptional regulator n=1 Tax=Brachybacterium hainanense TaxID=1541174 RepID=A0ABV6RB55_9MICO